MGHFERALRVTPGGSQTRSKAPGKVGPTGQGFPLYATHGEGAYVYDEHGRKYLDCFGANAAIPLGYNHPLVTSRVCQAMGEGSLLSLPSVREARVSESFLSLCAPWAEQVRWTKSGTEAVMAAVRIARASTGRSPVIVMDTSYHGWSDLNDARYPMGNGVPDPVRPLTRVVAYGSDPSTWPWEAGVAAVLIEPNRWEETSREWLMAVREVARAHGALVVYDEMVYGMRWAHGGSAEFYGVTPDLACFGKALGNGVPVACVCGRRDVMAEAGLLVSGTYFGDVLGLAAADAVLEIYRARDIVTKLWARGRETWMAFESQAPELAVLEGCAVHWRVSMVTWADPVGYCPDDQALDAVVALAAQRGVLVHRSSNNASAAMTPEEATHAGVVLGQCAAAVAGARA